MTDRCRQWIVASTAVALLGGCAAAVPGYTPTRERKGSLERLVVPKTGTVERAGTYTPSADEEKLNCRRLSGIIQLKILQVRSNKPQPATSRITAAAQKTMSAPMAGSPPKASDPGEHDKDVARLYGLNDLLRKKNCAVFDLEADLRPGADGDPVPVKAERSAKRK